MQGLRRISGSAQPALHRRPSTTCANAVSPPVSSAIKRNFGFSYTPPPFVPESPPRIEIDLPRYDAAENRTVDVVVAGAGPAGVATAARIASQDLSVVLVDPAPLQHWPNNYGVWCDEFEAMGLEDCFERVWSKANVWIRDGDERSLQRRYARVDRLKLKDKLLQQCVDSGVEFHFGRARTCTHNDSASTLVCMDGTNITATVIVDATGHVRKLTAMDGDHKPGYQAAYGIMAEVDSHCFDNDTMLFMDWRDAHAKKYPAMQQAYNDLPTFLYAMPFSDNRVFLEETSLVARPGVPFSDLKERLYARLKHLGIKVNQVVEEEYCLIPMGGVLPRRDQRVIGIGGTAGMVHPSTGYMVARTLGAVPQLADRVVDEVASFKQYGNSRGESLNLRSQYIWSSIWPSERLRQREFMTFGMEVLLKLDLPKTRDFFSAFFALSDYHWKGFLSSRLSLPELIVFGLTLFLNLEGRMKFDLLALGVPLAPGLVWNIVQAERMLPENKLGKGEVVKRPVGSQKAAVS